MPISALRPNAFRLAGEIADGAISWVCPLPYLRDVAVPALKQGAAKVGDIDDVFDDTWSLSYTERMCVRIVFVDTPSRSPTSP